MAVRLTAEVVESLGDAGKDRLYMDTLEPGFGLRVTPTGKRIFVTQRRIEGKPVRSTLGYWPTLSVKEAREMARAMLRAEKKEAPPAEPEKPAEPTFEEWADRWLSEHVRTKLKPATVRDYEQIAATLKDRFQGKPISAVTRSDVLKLHAEMQATPRRGNYFLQVISAIYNFAEQPTNPTKRVKRYRENRRERIMDAAELGRVFTAIADLEKREKLSVWACAALRFAIATGARPSEIRAVEWSHLNHNMKRVVLPDSKANRPRILYCSDLAWAVLTTTPKYGKFVFAGRSKDEPYQNLTRAWIVVRKAAKLPDVRLYDARHTFASEAAKAGHALPMIGALLGHTVAATTQRYVHLVGDPVSAASQDVGDRLAAAIAGGGADAKVVPIRRKRRAAK